MLAVAVTRLKKNVKNLSTFSCHLQSLLGNPGCLARYLALRSVLSLLSFVELPVVFFPDEIVEAAPTDDQEP